MDDTPIDVRYPWLKAGENNPNLPENPTDRDFAKAYATMVIVYQLQRDELAKSLKNNDEERREVLDLLKVMRKQSLNLPMPGWAKVHSVVLAVLTFATVWLLLFAHQRLLAEHFANASQDVVRTGH
jgi:hypothetical protein